MRRNEITDELIRLSKRAKELGFPQDVGEGEEMSERLFKCLGKGRMGPYSQFKWPKVGVWLEVVRPLEVCQNGIHLCQDKDLVSWLNAEIYEAEYAGERLDAYDKIVVRKARLTKRLKTWNARTQRLFACDCAERVLPIFEREYPDDDRPRQAIKIARRYAYGKATKKELAAAMDAAMAAAMDAEREWQTKRLLRYLYPEEAQDE